MSDDLPPGLDPATAAARARDEGPNEPGVDQRRTLLGIVIEVAREPLFLLLLGAGGLYLAMGDTHEALVLLGFVCIIVATTVLQERRTDNTLERLRGLSSPRAEVWRGGQRLRVPGAEVVRGDVLLLSEGERVPADAQVLQAHELAVDESMLTGESVPQPKTARSNAADGTTDASADATVDRADPGRVWAGTLVTSGQGVARVTAIGRHTALGQIGVSLGAIGWTASPLRDEMARLTRRLLAISVGVCLVFVALHMALRGDWLQALLSGIALAMGLLPQEFAVILIVFLALAARRLAAAQVLTRRLSAIETLGQATVLCVDKTGTLTENRMSVVALCTPHAEALDLPQPPSAGGACASATPLPDTLHELLEHALLASETRPHDPMELALHRLAQQALADTGRLHPDWALVREYELAPGLMAMSHLWQADGVGPAVVATKGAPEAIADLCHLPPDQRAQRLAQAAALAQRGWRVLAVAKARHTRGAEGDGWPADQRGLACEWLGLVALADPLRPEVPQAIADCRRAGVRVVMITGDHPHTALAIARQAGIQASRVLTGYDLSALPPAELAQAVGAVDVFARVQPQQKLALVEALKARGEVVAMTGDGVNDAPALKAAHIGVAMGQRGTDVAREAAALVLLQDDFSSIVQAIRRGRRTYANLRQAMVYTLAVHVPIVALAIWPVLWGWPLWLAPLHIAFLELVIDPSCSLVFEAEEGGTDPMQSPPRPPGEPLLGHAQVVLAMAQGGLVAGWALAGHALALAQGGAPGSAAAVAFTLLVTANAALIFPSRLPQTDWAGLWRGLAPVGLWVPGLTLLALLAVTTWPPLAQAFGFVPLSPLLWALTALGGLAVVLPLQWQKAWLTRWVAR